MGPAAPGRTCTAVKSITLRSLPMTAAARVHAATAPPYIWVRPDTLMINIPSVWVGTLSWASSAGAETYEVTAVSGDGNPLAFSTNITSGFLSELLCGQQYQITVRAINRQCRSVLSSPAYLSQMLFLFSSPLLNCDTNSAVVSWELSDNIKRHTVQATGSDGHRIDCSSFDHSCTLSGMHCGQSYNITVTALDGVCDNSNMHLFLQSGESADSLVHLMTEKCMIINTNGSCSCSLSAPCAPSNVQTSLHCDISNGGVVSVSWVQANGVESYTAVAESNNGHSYSCNTTAASCDLQELQCGQIYNVSVYSLAHGCGRVKSTTSQVQTAPCQPSSVQADVDCQSKDVFVSWDPSYVAQSYLLTVVGRNGDLKTCNTSDNNCTLTDLRCSNTYYVSVLASNENCTSLPSANITFQTVPCEPANLTANIQCGNSSSASLSWVGSTGAVVYTGLAQSETGTTVYCETTHTSCTLEGLVCGTVYNFTVQATDGFCNSSLSEPQTKGAGTTINLVQFIGMFSALVCLPKEPSPLLYGCQLV
uniref:Fibronectin type III domain containing 7, related sequence 4 n=1 Tax=Sinocyclocheilus rhinocerous TaxID=307959 RepID=A0A673N0Z3_9TELE